MKRNKIRIAVTGGIGSGKSTVCKIIKESGYPVYSCDETYKKVLQDAGTVEELAEVFGREIVDAHGTLNRAVLSALVFNDEEKLKKLNEITHPKIFEKMFADSESNEGMVFYEVPLLFEGGYQNLFDEIIVVLRDRNERINSVMFRDNLKEEEVTKRLIKQFDYDNSDFKQYYVIHNDAKISNMSDIISDILLKITEKYTN